MNAKRSRDNCGGCSLRLITASAFSIKYLCGFLDGQSKASSRFQLLFPYPTYCVVFSSLLWCPCTPKPFSSYNE